MSHGRFLEGDEPPARLLWDTQWVTDIASGVLGSGDWRLADEATDDPETWGGLRSNDALSTAIVLCLFTDKRRPDWLHAEDGAFDRRGWHGDSFDLDRAGGEREMGSLLWTLERADLNTDTGRMAEHYATEALQTLIDQRVIKQAIVRSEVDMLNYRLSLSVQVIGIDGDSVLEQSFPIR